MNRFKVLNLLIFFMSTCFITYGQVSHWECHIFDDPTPDPSRAACPDTTGAAISDDFIFVKKILVMH